MKKQSKGKRPIPHSLSMWNNGTEVLYRCPSCGCDFRILGPNEKFCHACGQKIDWSESVYNCSEEFKKLYHDLVYVQHKSLRSEEVVKLLFRLYSNEFREGSRYVCD